MPFLVSYRENQYEWIVCNQIVNLFKTIQLLIQFKLKMVLKLF